VQELLNDEQNLGLVWLFKDLKKIIKLKVKKDVHLDFLQLKSSYLREFEENSW
jgi:hypothetical protein